MLRNFELLKDPIEVPPTASEAMKTLSNSETSISKEEAEAFWNNMLDNSLADEIENNFDVELFNEIYDRSEDEFEFDFVIDTELRVKYLNTRRIGRAFPIMKRKRLSLNWLN